MTTARRSLQDAEHAPGRGCFKGKPSANAKLEHGGERAFYRPSTDHIQMPDEGLFCGTDRMTRGEAYYAVLVHELTHWTGAKHRLDRQMGKRFGDSAYAAEELVAEIGSAFLCAELGITQDIRVDHAQYLGAMAQAAEG